MFIGDGTPPANKLNSTTPWSHSIQGTPNTPVAKEGEGNWLGRGKDRDTSDILTFLSCVKPVLQHPSYVILPERLPDPPVR